MNEESKACDKSAGSNCGSRREFLVKAGSIAGGVVLSLSALPPVAAQKDGDKADNKNTAAQADELVLKLDEKSPLSKIGGFDTIETKAGKMVVVRRAEMSFSAYSAVCPHKGGPIKYDEKTQQLFCPWHDSRFDLKGQVTKGPAKQPLKVFSAQEAIVLTLKPNG